MALYGEIIASVKLGMISPYRRTNHALKLGIISPYMRTNHALKLGDYLSVQAHKPCSIAKARGFSLRTGAQTML